MARARSTPVCQDTGALVFYVCHPPGASLGRLQSEIEEAVAQGSPLRRACHELQLGEVRVHRWRARRRAGWRQCTANCLVRWPVAIARWLGWPRTGVPLPVWIGLAVLH